MFVPKFRHTALMLVMAATLVVALFARNTMRPVSAASALAPAHGTARASYGQLPLSFIANAGQTDPSVRFQVRSSGGTLSFESNGVMLSLADPRQDLNPTGYRPDPVNGVNPALVPRSGGTSGSRMVLTSGASRSGAPDAVTTIHLTFDQPNPNTSLTGADQLPGIANFFVSSDPSQWHTNVPTYAGVVYHDLYPGVDLHYAGHSGLLKGTYTIAAGVDPSLIRWQYAGTTGVTLDSSGNLTITAPGGVTLTEKAPVAWQTRDGMQMPVSVGYVVNSDGSAQFAPNGYDPSLPLTVDPGLDYSTYLGGSANDFGYGIAVDASGNAYATGYTSSTNFPTTPGAYQTTFIVGTDAFVSKLNAEGSALVYSTFLGGGAGGQGIAVDASGNAYVAGWTTGGFPTTTGAAQTTFGGANDAFAAKLNATGSALLYSTYLGGSGVDIGLGIAVDASANAYVTGYTASTNYPITLFTFQALYGGGTANAFVTKLNATGSALNYSTYLGGSGFDQGFGVAVNANGNAYVAGYATSTNFPTTPATWQSVISGSADAFVSKLSVSGNALVYSTYLGGTGLAQATGIALDGGGNAYVTGWTTNGFPIAGNAAQTVFGGGSNDAFVTRFNAGGDALLYSTYLGGSGNDIGYGIALDAGGNAIITGSTASTNFPVTIDAAQGAYGGGPNDAFVTKLPPAGFELLYSTFLGGSGDDVTNAIAVDGGGSAYVTGNTTGSFPTVPGAFRTTYGGGGHDVFVSKFNLSPARIDSIGVFRGGSFFMRLHNSTGFADISVAFSRGSKPYPVVGDWTGFGFDTVGTFDQSNGLFSLCKANVSATCANSANVTTLVLGNANDQPLSGRWLLTATHAGVGVFRPSNGLIFLKNALTTGFADDTMVLGIPGDVGLAGDWTGKGFDSPAVYRPSNSNFFLSNKVCNCSVFADIQFAYGIGGDAQIVGDWIGQGHDGVGLFRQTNGFTYLKNALITGFANISFVFGIAGDIPVAGHWQLTYPPEPPPARSTPTNPPAVLVPPTSVPQSGSRGNSGLGD